MKRRKLVEAFIPTAQFINELQPGERAPDVYGKWREVLDVAKRGEKDGRLFVIYHTEFGKSALRLALELHEGELVRTIPLCARLSQSKQRELENKMLRSGQTVAVL